MSYSLSHLSDQVLLRDLGTLVSRDRASTAELLAHLAEVDTRRLYVPAGYSSMFAYCVDELHLSEDAAYKRIQAARAARQFPVLFTAVAQGRLHLAAVCLLAPHLNAGNVDELIAVGEHQRKSEIERRLAERFPRTESMGLVEALPNPGPAPGPPTPPAGGETESAPIPAQTDTGQSAALQVDGAEPGKVQPAHLTPATELGGQARAPGVMATPSATGEVDAVGGSGAGAGQLAPGQVGVEAGPSRRVAGQPAPGQVDGSSLPPFKVTPSPERYRLQLTIGKGTYDNLRYAQALLSHSIPSGDLAQVLDRALTALVRELEKRKLGTGRRPRRRPRSSASGRYVSKHVRRAVWERDQGQCTFVSEAGHRCAERRFLEFDHIDPVARGGRATVERLRLRCRAHNQYEAERAFGTEFMSHKREQAQARGAPQTTT